MAPLAARADNGVSTQARAIVGRTMEMDAHPPASQERAVQRDPAIDLVRFTCLLLVVAAHCMMVSPVLHKDGTVTTLNVLMEQRWFTPVAWGLMIVPLFFVLGGVTGLQSWRRLKAHGGNGFDFAQLRLLRLVRPAMAVLAVMWGGLWVALLLGVHPAVIQLMTAGACDAPVVPGGLPHGPTQHPAHGPASRTRASADFRCAGGTDHRGGFPPRRCPRRGVREHDLRVVRCPATGIPHGRWLLRET